MSDSSHRELIGSADAERILDISRATLTRWVKAGKLRTAGQLSGSGALVFERGVVEQLAESLREAAAARSA